MSLASGDKHDSQQGSQQDFHGSPVLQQHLNDDHNCHTGRDHTDTRQHFPDMTLPAHHDMELDPPQDSSSQPRGSRDNSSFDALKTEKSRHLSARDGFVLLISIQIGSGIFTSASQVDKNVPSPAAALLSWFVGGILAWTGATSFAEFGAALPRSGGMQEYLRYVYGDVAAFSMAWAWIIIVKPTAMAILSLLLVESISSAVSPASSKPSVDFTQKLFAILALLTVVLLNCISTKVTARLGEGFVFMKLATVSLIVVGGVAVCSFRIILPDKRWGSNDWYMKNWFQSRQSPSDTIPIDWTRIGWWNLLGHFSSAINGGLWAYSGWDNANFIASEMSSPERSLPRAIHSSMVVVLVCFELVNASYYILLPWKDIGSNDAVAVTAARYLLGSSGGIVMAILVAISCAGALNGNIFVAGRLTVAAAKRGYFPGILSELGVLGLSGSTHRFNWRRNSGSWRPHCFPHSDLGREDNIQSAWIAVPTDDEGDRVTHDFLGGTDDALDQGADDGYNVPLNAIVLSTLLATVYILTGSFSVLLTFVGMAEYTFFFLTILGLVILRVREPSLPRPYKPPVIIPVAFCIVSAAVVFRTAVFVPIQGVVLVLLLGGGIVLQLRKG